MSPTVGGALAPYKGSCHRVAFGVSDRAETESGASMPEPERQAAERL
jgi:hypothetical protein